MGTATIKLAPDLGVDRLLLVGRSATRLAAARTLAVGLAADTVAVEDLPADWEPTQALTDALRQLAPTGSR